MGHSFDIEIAQKVGINAAIIYKHIQFWCAKNKANDKHFYDGYYWTYNSTKAFTELFPYLTEKQISYAINKLVDAKLIGKAKYNKQNYDQTLWYTDFTKLSNQDDKIVEPIPYNKQHIVNNKDISKDISGDTENFQFGKSSSKQKKHNNSDEYENAILLVQNYTDNLELISKLKEFVSGIKELKGKQRYKFYSSTIKNYLDELTETFGSDENEKIESVKLSIRYNYTTKVMKPYSNKKDFSVHNDIERIGSYDDYENYNHTKSERSF